MNAQKYKPAVLQNESHPYLQEKDLRDFCQIHNIVFQVIILKVNRDNCLSRHILPLVLVIDHGVNLVRLLLAHQKLDMK